MITVIEVGLLDIHAVKGHDLRHKTFKSKEVKDITILMMSRT